MPKAYSMDLRERVAADHDAGLGIALKYSVSPAWVRRLIQQRRERGDLEPRTGGHYPRKFCWTRLAELVEQQPDATLAELRDRLGVDCALSAIHKALGDLKITYKKDAPRRRAGPAGRRRASGPLAGRTTGDRPKQADLHR
ncbi:MAG: IS630 transposase-related protein [Planctomycetota bacterium]